MSKDIKIAEGKAEVQEQAAPVAEPQVAPKAAKPKLSQKERLEAAAKKHEENMRKAQAQREALNAKETGKAAKAKEREAQKAAALVEKALKAAQKPAKKDKAASVGQRGGHSPNKGKVIKILTEGKKNPRRPGTNGHYSFSLMKDGMSYDEFIVAGGRSVDLAYDIEHGHIKMVDVGPIIEGAGLPLDPEPVAAE